MFFSMPIGTYVYMFNTAYTPYVYNFSLVCARDILELFSKKLAHFSVTI